MEKKRIFSREHLLSDVAVLTYLALIKLVIHFLSGGHYGYFRDELYYLACGDHLDWGYVDQPPLLAVITGVARMLLGDSLFAIHLLPAVAGALKVFLTGLIVRDIGGNRYAQVLAALAVIIAPVWLSIDNYLSMNAFEAVLWTGSVYIVVRIIKGGDQRLWLLLGLLAGLGLLNKHSMAFFIVAVVGGLLLTPQRKVVFNRWFLLGGVVAFVLFLPHLVWQITHNFPTLEWQNNVVAQNKNVQLSPVEFFLQQILMVHPLTFPIWLLGLHGFFFSDFGKEFRAFGWAYIFLFLIFIVLGAKAKAYYLTPIYPVLLGGGAVAISSFILRRERYSWVRPTLISVLIIGGAYTAPLVLPILPEETFIEYAKLMPVSGSAGERHRMGKLPQQYADMHGWEELAADVATAFLRLSPEEQQRCAIYGQNYGEAGAIDLFGRKYNLPKAISGHQNYYFWGPREYTGELVIVIGDSKESLEQKFLSVELAAVHRSEYAMPYEDNLPIFVCRGLRWPLKELWPKVKSWI